MDYPLLNLFLTMLYFFLWIAWLFLLFRIILDIFRSQDLGGWGKAGWTILILFVPFLGVLIYLIARGSSMQERDMQQARESRQAMDKYITETAPFTLAKDPASLPRVGAVLHNLLEALRMSSHALWRNTLRRFLAQKVLGDAVKVGRPFPD